jgi:hypothetical protein
MDSQAEKLNIVVHRQVHRNEAGDFQDALAYFEPQFSTAAPDDAPTVNLSRSGHNPECEYTVTNLFQHYKHSPTWEDEEAMETYIKRVLADVQKIVEA